IEAVQTAWNRAEPVMVHEVRDLQRAQIEQIGQQEQELFARMELLKSESDAILEQMEALKQDIGRLGRKAPQVGFQENRAEPDFRMIVDKGTEFVTRMRKQHIAVRTWLMEAFNRVQGPGN